MICFGKVRMVWLQYDMSLGKKNVFLSYDMALKRKKDFDTI